MSQQNSTKKIKYISKRHNYSNRTRRQTRHPEYGGTPSEDALRYYMGYARGEPVQETKTYNEQIINWLCHTITTTDEKNFLTELNQWKTKLMKESEKLRGRQFNTY